MEQIVKRKKKPVIKIFLVVVLSTILVDFIIYLINYFNKKIPYLSTFIAVFIVVVVCSWLLIKYFSDYSYEISYDHIIFSRLIGKRKFEMLYIRKENLLEVEVYDEEKYNKKILYDFSLDKSKKYIGKYRKNNKEHYFLFSPNENFLRVLEEII